MGRIGPGVTVGRMDSWDCRCGYRHESLLEEIVVSVLIKILQESN